MTVRYGMRKGLTVALLGCPLAFAGGCKSSQDKANEAAIAQAKQQAVATGTPQQVVWADKDGNATTVVVQPPAAGQATQQVTTTVTKNGASGGSPAQSTITTTTMQPLASAPAVAPAASSASGPPVGPAPYGTGSGAAQAGAVQPAAGPVISPVDMEIPSGTTLAVRVNQRISVKTARAGDHFSGEIARPVIQNGREVIRQGTPVEGRIDESHRRGHFKGRSILELRLISMNLNGTNYRLDTRDNVRTKRGKGKRTAAFIGGGAGLGMLVGGVATGGVGLLVGGLVGGGAGTALGGLTGNRDLVIPAETVVDFRLADDLVVQPM